jgi:hypothetical protein
MVSSPQIRDASTTTTGLVRNAILVNNVQSQVHVQRAIHSFSKDFRLRGQIFTIESILSPLIHRFPSLKHAVLANFALQSEQFKQSPSLPSLNRDLANVHVRHYNTAIHYLQTTLHNPLYADANVGASLILAFYDLCAGDMEHWTTHIRSTSEQIRIRGQTVSTHPLPLHTKFLYALYMRADIIGSNSVGQPCNADREIAKIVYSGVPISNKNLLPVRVELELLLAEISLVQYECITLLPPTSRDWNDPHQETVLRQKYEDLMDRLQRWQGRDPELFAFEEAVGEYPHGAMLPPEMGLPLLCVVLFTSCSLLTHCRTIKSWRKCGVYIVLQLFTCMSLPLDIASFLMFPLKLEKSLSFAVE